MVGWFLFRHLVLLVYWCGRNLFYDFRDKKKKKNRKEEKKKKEEKKEEDPLLLLLLLFFVLLLLLLHNWRVSTSNFLVFGWCTMGPGVV